MRKVSKFSQRREFTSEGISGPLDWTGRITWFNSQPQYEEHLEVQKLDWLITVTLDFPGSPVVMTVSFHCRGLSSIPVQGTKILHAVWCGQK